jgi:hypothetical protein
MSIRFPVKIGYARIKSHWFMERVMSYKTPKLILISFVIMISSLMCSLFVPGNSHIVSEQERKATIESLQLTMSAMQDKVVTATIEPTKPIGFPTMAIPSVGEISGTLSYPSENIPPLRVVAIKVGTGEYFATEITGQNVYKLEGLPEGKYHVLAYRMDSGGADPGLVGGFSQYVLCGQTTDCTDHSLVDVVVMAGIPISNINPMDWYAPAGTYPTDPTK